MDCLGKVHEFLAGEVVRWWAERADTELRLIDDIQLEIRITKVDLSSFAFLTVL